MGTFDTEPEWITPKRHYAPKPLKLSDDEQEFLDFMRAEAASSDEPWLPRRQAALEKWESTHGKG